MRARAKQVTRSDLAVWHRREHPGPGGHQARKSGKPTGGARGQGLMLAVGAAIGCR